MKAKKFIIYPLVAFGYLCISNVAYSETCDNYSPSQCKGKDLGTKVTVSTLSGNSTRTCVKSQGATVTNGSVRCILGAS